MFALGVASRCSRVVSLRTFVRRAAAQPEGQPFESNVGGAIRRFRDHRSSNSMTALLAYQLELDRRAGFRRHAAAPGAPVCGREWNGGVIIVAASVPRPQYAGAGSAGSAHGGCSP
jgi:hypothetical protein